MSRLAKRPMQIPQGIDVTTSGQKVTVKGSKGSKELLLPEGIGIAIAEGGVTIDAREDLKDRNRLLGLYRALLRNMIAGLSTGFEKRLEMHGVGFRAAMKGAMLDLQVGFSHPTQMEVPEGLEVKVEENTKIVIGGTDAQQVGQFAAEVRALRPPEPYKQKGIRYQGEYVRKKAGKAAK